MVRTPFTRDEIVLCAYAARFDGTDFGAVEAIHSIGSRSRDSIQLKVLNIAAMLDEEGVPRESAVNPLSGLPAGQQGRRTNWDIVSELLSLTREQHLAECRAILGQVESTSGKPLREGAVRQVVVKDYERDPHARRLCIAHHGTTCVICGFSFGETYGAVAEGFIHVHHVQPLAEIGAEHTVDPVRDLRPVCPNCHAVLHLRVPVYSIAEARALLRKRAHGGAPAASRLFSPLG